MEISKILNSTLDDIVFEKKNKSYGAYMLRKEYSKYVNRASIIVFISLIILALIPVVQGWIEGFAKADKPKVVKVDYTKLAPPPPLENTPPPPPPPKLPPPPKEIKFTPPVIKPDEEVKPEDQPPPQEELEKKPVGPTTSDVGSDIQVTPPDPGKGVVEDAKPQIFTFVEQPPEFPGGEDAMRAYLASHIHYPPMAKEQNIEGIVYLQFVVDGTGSISDVKVLRKPSDDLAAEAVRVVKTMPKFKPGKQNGQSVSVYFTLPINFQLSGN